MTLLSLDRSSLKFLFIFLLVVTLSACSTHNLGSDSYSSSEIGRVSEVKSGTIVSARQVEIQGQGGGAGFLAGAIAGGAAGSTAGGGNGKTVMSIVGALLGGIIGSAAQGNMRDGKGIEYTIRLTDGNTVSITQNLRKGDEILRSGSAVMIRTEGRIQRVVPANDLIK